MCVAPLAIVRRHSSVCADAYYVNLFQDGTVQQELKLTGILQLYTLAPGESSGVWGTEVAPGVVAHHHQHLFSTRIDPMIDGLANSVVETDVVPADEPTGSTGNYAGNGFEARKRVLETASEAVRDYDAEKSRSWSIVNESSTHYASKQPAGFKVRSLSVLSKCKGEHFYAQIMCKDAPRLLAKPDSLVAKRCPFAMHNLWLVPKPEERLFPAGKYPTQTITAPADSVSHWAAGEERVRNEDIAIFYTWGVTHVPRPEDFRALLNSSFTRSTVAKRAHSHHAHRASQSDLEGSRALCKSCVMLELRGVQPVSFFKVNPALDVLATKDAASRHANAQHANGVNGSGCH